MNYPALSLRALAGVTGITSAVAAYPVASDLFGTIPGGVVLASSAAAIYAGWHVVATSSDTDKRVIASAVAGVFAVAMVAGIHNSAQLATATAATTAATEADRLYQEQETARMAALSAMTAELRATQKSKYPGEYAALQKQVDRLSTPTVRQATASQITQGLTDTGGVYRWAVSSVFELVTPALLLLAGMFSRRNPTATATATPQPFEVEEVEETATAPQPEAAVTATPTTTAPQPIDLLAEHAIAPNGEGNVTAAAIVAATGCTDWQAKDAMKKAAEQGILTKTGTGGATRYRYANKLRAVK
ncbi:hypothetical protein VSS37_06030 [Candidatus Thiothrix sp. Deng01]|uniref:Uncharacterized protein n=1 Tax=Candidatus Thiothrix phosphatis TaxID=3112415 RepID=A0ABU6CUL6_9GAMM|nr:hypothetical protein [Candidatus Thiothrix sp. Deng01]MEB4590531.1 hypothetical protein [Candidatus Thiothrix sp. Deng01]